MRISVVIEGPDKIVNKFTGDIVRNAPPEVEVDFTGIIVEKNDEPQHEHLKEEKEE